MTSTQAEFADDEYVLVYNEETKSYQAMRIIPSTKINGFEKICNGADGSSKQLPSVKKISKKEVIKRRESQSQIREQFDDNRSRRMLMLNSGGFYNYNWRWSTRQRYPYRGIPSELTILDTVRSDAYRKSSLD